MAEKRPTLHLERLAPALRAAGAVLLAAGLVHLYADRVIFDARPFAARAALSLGDPRVASLRGRAHRRRGDRAEARPDGLPPAARGHRARGRQLGGVPGRLPAHGRGRSRAALLAGRRARGARRCPTSACWCGARSRTTPSSWPASPRSCAPASRCGPSGKGARALLKLARLGHRFRRNAILAIGSGVLLLFLGIALPRGRQAALLQAAARRSRPRRSCSSSCRRSAARPSRCRSSDPALRPVAAGLCDAFTGGLRTWALVLAGIGIVLASAASSLARRVEVEDVARSLWRRLQQPAQKPRGRDAARAARSPGSGCWRRSRRSTRCAASPSWSPARSSPSRACASCS